MNKKQALMVKGLAKPCNDVLKKLGWKWEPKVGEWFIRDDKIDLVTDVRWDDLHVKHLILTRWSGWFDIEKEKVIPILYWEEIERVLEEMGYGITIKEWCGLSKQGRFGARIYKGLHFYDWYSGKSRQLAVMLAAIQLEKGGGIGNG